MTRYGDSRKRRAHHSKWKVNEVCSGIEPVLANHAETGEHLSVYPYHAGYPAPLPTTPYVCYSDQTTPYPTLSFPYNGHAFAVPCQSLALDKPISGLNYGGPIAILVYPHQYSNDATALDDACAYYNPNPYMDYSNLQVNYPSYPLEANAFDAFIQSDGSVYSNSASTSISLSNVDPTTDTSRSTPTSEYTDYGGRTFQFSTGKRNLFYVENIVSCTSLFVSSNAFLWGFQNPLVHILRKKREIVCAFKLPTRIHYARITPHNIKFAGNEGTCPAYLIDEASTKTCWATFPFIEDIVEEGQRWMRNNLRDNVLNHDVADAEVINFKHGNVNLTSDGKKLNKVTLAIGRTKISSRIENEPNRPAYVYLSTFVGQYRANLHFSRDTLTVRFYTQTAQLDQFGKLKLGFPWKVKAKLS